MATGNPAAVGAPPNDGDCGGVVALAAEAGFAVACYDTRGVGVFRVEGNSAPAANSSGFRLTACLRGECEEWFGDTRVVAVNLHGSEACFTTRGGAVIGVSLSQGVVLWQTPALFSGMTGSVAVGRRLFAGTNDGVVSLDVALLRTLGACTTHVEDKAPSTLDYMLAEYLPPIVFVAGVVVLVVEVLQMMRFATSTATPQV